MDRRIGFRVRALRREANLSLEALADQLGLSFQQLQKYEKGVNRISAGLLDTIANILNVPVSTFYAAEAVNEMPDPLDTAALKCELAGLVGQIDCPRNLATAITVLRALGRPAA
ncbi:MAG: helix-turn-helix transcriptional regulator [Pseudomonadota bacterium]